ncbi:hypothetical protein B0H34DRAFT_272058 [Crassisporium funariophilum]|nr:hypothetical protein B0H34DRAFT_272058 [Crassisporium funariophilum]
MILPASAIFVLVSVVVSCLSAATIEEVKAGLTSIADRVNVMDNAVASLSGGKTGIATLNMFHDAADKLGRVINETAVNINGMQKPVSLADGNVMLNSVQGLESGLHAARINLKAKKRLFKPTSDAFMIPLVERDLAAIIRQTEQLWGTTIQALPPAVRAQATSLKLDKMSAYDSAIRAFLPE